jgi:O-antigen ligase/Flp pilus assembly protein TadD
MNRRFEFLFALFFFLLVLICFSSLMPLLQYITIGLLTLGGGYWLLRRALLHYPIKISNSILFLGLYLLHQTVLLLVTPLPIYSFETMLDNFLIFLVFVFCVNYFDANEKTRVWENALISVAVVLVSIELLLVVIWYWNWWQISGLGFSLPPIGYRLSGTFLGHPNIMAGFINLVLPIALIRLIAAERRSRRILWVGILILFAVIQYYSSSRGGWISGFGALSVTLFLVYGLPLVSSRQSQPWKRFWLFVQHNRFIFAGAAVVLLGVFLVLMRSVQMTPGHGGRLGLWQNGWRVWMKSPLLGHGAGSYPILNAREVQLPPGFATAHAHNLWLQIGAETGILGVLIVLAILGTAVVSWFRAWRKSKNFQNKRYALMAYAGAGTAVLLHGVVDYLFHPPLYTISVLMVFSFVLFYDQKRSFCRLSTRRSFAVIALILGVWSFGSLFSLRGEMTYWEGVSLGRQGDWESAQRLICQAADQRPELSIYQFQCGLASAHRYQQDENPAWLDVAEQALERGLAIDPFWPVHTANLAMVKWQQGEREEAADTLRQAVDDAPRNALFAFNLAWMEEKLENTQKANAAYAQAAQHDHWVRYTMLLHQEDNFSRHAEKKLEASDLPAHIQGYGLLRDGHLDRASEILEAVIDSNPLNGEAYALRAIVYQRQGKPALAWQDVQTGLLIEPSSRVYLWASEVALHQGKDDKAFAYVERAYGQLQNRNEFSEPYYYGVYHRYFLDVDLVPGYQRGDLPPEMVDRLIWLAEWYQEKSLEQEARRLVWLQSTKLR